MILWQNMSLLVSLPDISFCVSEMRVSKRQTIPCQHGITPLFYQRSEQRDGMVVATSMYRTSCRDWPNMDTGSDALDLEHLGSLFLYFFIKQIQAKHLIPVSPLQNNLLCHNSFLWARDQHSCRSIFIGTHI